jgi:hypothetical protein
MEDLEFEKMQTAVRRVEQRLRLVTAGWILSLTAFLVLGLWGQQVLSQTSVLRGRRLEVIDDSGQTRIALDAVGRRPSMWFYDTAGKRRLGLMVVPPEVPVIWLLDPEERSRIELSVLPDGANAFVLSDAQRRARLLFNVGADGTPSLSLSEALGRPRILLKVLSTGVPGFWLFDANGRIKFSPP